MIQLKNAEFMLNDALQLIKTSPEESREHLTQVINLLNAVGRDLEEFKNNCAFIPKVLSSNSR